MEFLEPKLLTMGPVLDVETGVRGEGPRGKDHGRGSCEGGGRPWPRIVRHSSTPLNFGLTGSKLGL